MNYLFLDSDGKFFLRDLPTNRETGIIMLPKTPPPPNLYADVETEPIFSTAYQPCRWFNPATHEIQTIFVEYAHWDKDKTKVYNEIREFFGAATIDSRFHIPAGLFDIIARKGQYYHLTDYIEEIWTDLRFYKKACAAAEWRNVAYRSIIKGLARRLRGLRRAYDFLGGSL